MRWLLFQAALIATAFQPQAQMAPTAETIEVNVVEVDVVVLDAQGKPVRGLTRDDFELTVGRRKRPISNFYAIDRGTMDATKEAQAGTPVARRNYLVLFVDDLHLHQRGKKRALDALRAFVRQQVHRGTAAMLIVLKGDVRVAQRFTEDAASLIRAIDTLERQPAQISQYESARREVLDMIDAAKREHELAQMLYQHILSFAEQERTMTERTIGALGDVIRSTAGLDGRRMLVYLSDGLPMQPAAEIFDYYHPEEFLSEGSSSNRAITAVAQLQPLDAMRVNLSSKFQELAQESAAAGVQFFAIDASGVHGFDDMAAENQGSRLDSSLIRANLHGPIQLLADETGGRAIVDQNDLGAAFAELDDHLSTYYSLGFHSDGSNRAEDISVRVRKRELTVRATKHVRERSTREQIEDRVRAALYSRIEENPLEATVAVAPSGGSQPGLSAIVRVPVSRLSVFADEQGRAWFAVFVMMMDENTRETRLRMIQHKVMPSEAAEAVQRLSITTRPGKYVVSFAVVDGYSWQATYVQREVTIPPN
jgi:VWFA-related protein